MGGVPILLALAAVTVDYGYQPDGKGGVEYIVQVTPEEFEYAKKAGEISSTVDASVRGRVSRFVLRVGNGQLPRDAGPPPATVAQAQGFENLGGLADRDHVPIPEIPDGAADHAAPPIPALAMQAPPPVTRAKPQEAPSMSMPTGAGTPFADEAQRRAQALQQMEAEARGTINNAAQQASDLARDAANAMQDPLRRLQPNGGDPTNPMRVAAAPTTGAATPFPSTSMTNPPGAASPLGAANTGQPAATGSPGLQIPSTSQTARDNQWDRQPTARPEPSTTPRMPSTSAQAAVGNFGAPPPGIQDPRLTTTAVGSPNSSLGNPQFPYQNQNQNQSPGSSPGTTAPTGDGSPAGTGTYNGQGSYAATGQPGTGQAVPGGQLAGGTANGAYPGSAAPSNAYPGTGYPTGGYPQGGYPQGNYPANTYLPSGYGANGPPSGYGPSGQLASNYSAGDPRGSTGLLPDSLTNVGNPNGPSRPGAALNGPAEEDENRGLPQQVFNLLLLLSLIANAYLVIQMSKLIQRYRDLRVNLRAATAGNAPPSPATA